VAISKLQVCVMRYKFWAFQVLGGKKALDLPDTSCLPRRLNNLHKLLKALLRVQKARVVYVTAGWKITDSMIYNSTVSSAPVLYPWVDKTVAAEIEISC
jgi:hypothetical protein